MVCVFPGLSGKESLSFLTALCFSVLLINGVLTASLDLHSEIVFVFLFLSQYEQFFNMYIYKGADL